MLVPYGEKGEKNDEYFAVSLLHKLRQPDTHKRVVSVMLNEKLRACLSQSRSLSDRDNNVYHH